VELGNPVKAPFPHTSGEQRQGNGIAIATKKLAGFHFARAAAPGARSEPAERESEKLIVLLGRWSRKVESPPPMGQRPVCWRILFREDLLNVGEEIRQILSTI